MSVVNLVVRSEDGRRGYYDGLRMALTMIEMELARGNKDLTRLRDWLTGVISTQPDLVATIERKADP